MTYGFMTHSYLNSAELRQMKKERARVTAEYKVNPNSISWPVCCTCRERPYPHTHERQWIGVKK